MNIIVNKICIIQYNKYNLQIRDRFPRIFFLNLLTKKLEQKGYTVILLKSDYPKMINEILEKYNKIELLLNFEDYYIRFSREFHSELNLQDVYQFYKVLEKTGTKIYPPPDFHIYTNSKTYALEMYKHSEYILPHSKTYLLKKSVEKNNLIWKSMIEHLLTLKKICDCTVIKVGYSADMKDVYFINNNSSDLLKNKLSEDIPSAQIIDFNIINDLEVIRKLYNEYIEYDKLDLVVIIQPYNKIVANRETEYRMWYIDGTFIGYFCYGIIKNKEGKVVKLLNNEMYNYENKIHNNLLHLGNKLYNFINKEIKKVMNDPDFKIIALRLDMSYAVEKIFQDKYSVKINDENYRFYCNEMENIDGTFYLNLPIKNTKINKFNDNSKIQYKLVDLLIKYA